MKCRFCAKSGQGHAETIPAYRLPRTVLPSHYKLLLKPDLDAATFEGEVTIDVDVTEPTSQVKLHAKDLNITAATISRSNGTAFTATVTDENGKPLDGSVELDKDACNAVLSVNGTIGKGKWQIHLSFRGVLNDKLKGFYRSSYTDDAGVEKFIATTQFESTDARRAFPCFDEPDMKAVFEVSLEVADHLTAISCGPDIATTKVGDNKKRVDFKATMKMPTYVLAFIVGEFECTDPINVDGTDVRVFTVPGKLHLATFALEASAHALRYYNRYFGVKYPGDKLDNIAIPDFNAGAMENLGCVTYREELLVDPDTATQGSLDWVAEVVHHEIAHMWFGDLVSMGWWNGLWLKEAFATFLSYVAVEHWKPTWGVWEKFGPNRSAAFRTDSLRSTRPVEFHVGSPEEAEGMYDVLTYEKGCSVMRMLEQYLGAETYRQGLAIYVARHQYGNTDTPDLWAALSEASGKDVAALMHSWIFKPGFPVVQVRRGDVAGTVILKQQQFKFLADAVDNDALWNIPVLLRAKTAEGTTDTWVMLDTREKTVHLGEGLEYVVVNAGGHGFYRSDYSEELLEKVTANLASLSVIERYNLASDTWACIRAGLATTEEFLEMASLFKDEKDPIVWSAILGPLGTVRSTLPTANRPAFEAMVRDLVRPTFERLGWDLQDGESIQVRELRGDVIFAMGSTGRDGDVVAEARKRFNAWKGDNTLLSGDVLSTVIGLVARNGDAALYDDFLALMKTHANNPELENEFKYGLANFPTHDLVQQTLAHALNPKMIRTQDAPSMVARMLGHDTEGREVWNFVRANWDKMAELFSDSGLVRVCSGVVALNTLELEAEVLEFFTGRTVKGGDKAIPQNLESLRVSVLYRERELTPLTARYASPAPAGDGEKTEGGDADGAIPAVADIADRQDDGAIRPPVPADAVTGRA